MRFDFVIVGGGLSGALTALAVLDRRPTATLALVDRDVRLGGSHTWCFHAYDVPARDAALIVPLVVARWPSYDVRFPDRARTVESPYAAVTSERLDDVIRERLASHADRARRIVADVASVEPEHVLTRDGLRIDGHLVIDARGPAPAAASTACAWQKFVGLELELDADSGIERPIVFDANVAQSDGFRFFYALPLGPRRVLLEDTYFSDRADLDDAALETLVLERAATMGLHVARIVRRERGVLPLPLRVEPSVVDTRSPLAIGYAGGFFHPTTGYSFPVAVRVASLLADLGPDAASDPRWRAFVDEQARQCRFARLLNRWLFSAMPPAERWRLLSRFYGLPTETIARFYALEMRATDRARIVCGRPPRGISLRAALMEVMP